MRVAETVAVEGQRKFKFDLFSRPIQLGSHGRVTYFWMDASSLGNPNSPSGLENYRNIMGHWAAARQSMGCFGDLREQAHFVLASTYPLFVSSKKAMQRVYLDAFLDPARSKKLEVSVPQAISRRIRQVVKTRDRFAVATELNDALGRYFPPARALPLLTEACRHWIGSGVQLLRQSGPDGLERFLRNVDAWQIKLRKDGGHEWARRFLNLFAFEARAAFFTCYANVWVALIPRLKEKHGLDEPSEWFLRMWHHQNQPIEIPHGQTTAGVLYPVRGTATIVTAKNGHGQHPAAVSWDTPRLAPTHVQDVLSGHVLALHPLSGFLMQDTALSELAGRFFFSTECRETLKQSGRSDLHPEYWDLVGAILSAAHLYRRAHDELASTRGVQLLGGRSVEHAAEIEEPGELSESEMLLDYIKSTKTACPNCGQTKIRFESCENGEEDMETVTVHLRCGKCDRSFTHEVDGTAFARWLHN